METFSQTSNESYDRHFYKVHFYSQKPLKFEYYEDAQRYWFEKSQVPNFIKFITVEDRKGFKK
jgi:predicted transglutaminase-like protease